MTITRSRAAPPPTFREVNPAHSSKQFRAYVEKALEVLKKSDTPIGRATYAHLASGKVKIDELTDLTRPDFDRARKTLSGWGTALKKDDYQKLHDPKSRAARVVTENLTGYQWDNRIYVEKGLSPKKLASTLVHEVNHVLNKSEENYRSDTKALLQEYRAFYAEKLFAGETMTPAKCLALKKQVAKSYGFDQARLAEIPDVPRGLPIP